jgi:Flp pilus assembly protein TadD
MMGEKDRALGVLDAATVSEIAAAAMLKVQLMHEAGDFDGAIEEARRALELHPDDAGLCAAVGTLALDVEDTELAALCAGKAGDHPEGLAVTGMLEMQIGDPATALQTFSRSIEVRQHNPRAWIGRGLARMLLSDNSGAAADIDEGASQFGDHIGSWIAAGWAHFLAGDVAAAKTRFERALAIDPNFAESHGSLAVLDVAQGDAGSARRRMTTALRLDRECFSAAMAQVLLNNDDPAKIQEIVARAFSTPLNGEGMTVAGYMSGLVRPTVH